MGLPAGRELEHLARTAEDDAVRHDLTLGDGRAESPRGAEEHLAVCRAAQSPAGRPRGDQGLDQHGHRGVGRVDAAAGHVTQGARRPERSPAGPDRGQEVGLAVETEVALELAGERGARAILHQCRGAHDARSARLFADCGPRGQQRREHHWCDGSIHQAESHRECVAPRLRPFGGEHAAGGRLEVQGRHLDAVGASVETEPARDRQARPAERRQVAGLGAESATVRGLGGRERDDEIRHR